MWNLGTLRLFSSISNLAADGMNIQPRLSEDMEEGTAIVVVQLQNMHEFVFLFHAILAALRTRAPATALASACGELLTGFGENEVAPAFQAWMGIGQ